MQHAARAADGEGWDPPLAGGAMKKLAGEEVRREEGRWGLSEGAGGQR